jgi:hypothetical protein
MNPLSFDLSQSLARFDAWWRGELLDRPPLRFYLQPTRQVALPPQPPTIRDRWMNPRFACDSGLAHCTGLDWLADSAPIYMPNVGPDLTGALYGCDLEFGGDTSWSTHPIESLEDYAHLASLKPDFSNPYWRAIEEMTRLAHAGKPANGTLVGITDLHGAMDTLVSLRGPERLCLDLVDEPEAVHAALNNLVRGIQEAFRRSHKLQLEAGQTVCTTWATFLHRGPAYVSSCDFLALISPAMARKFVRPYLRHEWSPLERSLFHLDGPGALRHLDWLLEEDWIQAIQWVYGAGRGPASKWIDVYSKIRAAGRSIHLLAAGPDDALQVIREIGPSGVWIELLDFRFESASGAERFMKALQRLV